MKLIMENWKKYLAEAPLLQERLSPQGDEGGDIKRAVGQGPGIHKITPRSARGLGRNWEPWRGHRFRWVEPANVQDKVQSIARS